jgi:hypothetical protein
LDDERLCINDTFKVMSLRFASRKENYRISMKMAVHGWVLKLDAIHGTTGFPTKIMYAFLISLLLGACTASIIFLN